MTTKGFEPVMLIGLAATFSSFSIIFTQVSLYQLESGANPLYKCKTGENERENCLNLFLIK